MRVLFGIVMGMLAGFAAATWFYGQGGNVIVDGRELFPRSAASPARTSPSPAPAAAARTTPPRRENRVVVRDVTDEPAPPPAAAPATPPDATVASAGAPNATVARYELGPFLVVLVPRL